MAHAFRFPIKHYFPSSGSWVRTKSWEIPPCGQYVGHSILLHLCCLLQGSTMGSTGKGNAALFQPLSPGSLPVLPSVPRSAPTPPAEKVARPLSPSPSEMSTMMDAWPGTGPAPAKPVAPGSPPATIPAGNDQFFSQEGLTPVCNRFHRAGRRLVNSHKCITLVC